MKPEAVAAPVKSRTIADLPFASAEVFGDRSAARFKRDGSWIDLSFREVAERMSEIARGFIDLGIEPGDRVCILANTRLEWTLADFGISAAGAITVPIYPTNSPEECEWVASNSGARAIVCENDAQLGKILQVRERLLDLETLIAIDPP